MVEGDGEHLCVPEVPTKKLLKVLDVKTTFSLKDVGNAIAKSNLIDDLLEVSEMVKVKVDPMKAEEVELKSGVGSVGGDGELDPGDASVGLATGF